MKISFPINGFLGTEAPFEADFNLVIQLVMGAALIGGAVLARRKRYAAHGICQTTVLLMNLLMIGLVMWPHFRDEVKPRLPKVLHQRYYATAGFHAVLGMAAEALGLYIAVVAGTNVLPKWLRFTNWKRWMRMELILWSLVVLTGFGTYYVWYVAPLR